MAAAQPAGIITSRLRFTLGPDDADQRLDRFLRKVLPAASLGQVFAGLRRAEVKVNGARADGAQRLRQGDVVDVGPALAWAAASATPGSPEPAGPAGRVGTVLVVVHRDADLLVVDKPAGLAVHPGTGVRDHLLGFVQAQYGAGRGHTFRIAPAHRLDRDTSGLVVFGASAAGLRGFTAALRAGEVTKTYLAVVHGEAPPSGTIDLPLERAADRPVGPRMQPARDGVRACTRFVRRASAGGRSLLAVDLVTGRTHQIRVHLAALGHPIVGDRRYGRSDRAERLYLHAWRLRMRHPVTGAALDLEAVPPPELHLDGVPDGVPDA